MALHGRSYFPLLFIILLSFESCHVARYVYWNYADVSDYKKFPADTIRTGPAFHTFKKSVKTTSLVLPAGYQAGADSASLDAFLEKNQTLAFLIIRNDTLIVENYFRGYNRNSVIPSFSVAKSFLSALFGIALSEGYIRDIHQPVTDYLPELKDPGFRKVTLEDLLTMRSGVSFNEGYNDPFSGAAKFYYGLNLRKYTLELKVVSPPDSAYDYVSCNAQILAMALEKATGRRLSDYFEEKIWKPMGAEQPATWSLDSKKNREARAFCCINAVPGDFARFGQLFLDDGTSDGRQVIPGSWVKESLTIRNDSKDSQGYPYAYYWRVLDDGSFFAKGILGQFIYVYPSKKIVIVRMGEKAGTVVWPEFFRQLAKQL
ncbi:MAG: serine hydrolase [Bacteroidetes bacterium]|nr:serine hydrolase [Bacteroidota bacterium]